MKKNIISSLYITIGLLYFLLGSCAEDKGNYDYVPVNDIVFAGIPQDTSVVQLELLKITPIFNRSLEATEEGLEYSWVVDGKEIANTRNLEYLIPQDMKIKKYTCYYTVTDTRNGMKYYTKFDFSVTSVISWGYYFFCEEPDGTSVISYFPAKEGATECLHMDKIGDYPLGKYPQAVLDYFGYMDALNDYFFTIYFISKEGDYPVIATDNGAFMPTYYANGDNFIDGAADFYPTGGVCDKRNNVSFISDGKVINYVNGLLYRPARHDKEYYWSHPAINVTVMYAFDELSKKFYLLKKQINDPILGLVTDPNAYDRVVALKDQPSFEGHTIVAQYVNNSWSMYAATAEPGKLHLLRFDYTSKTEDGGVKEHVFFDVPGVDENTCAVVSDDSWYVVAGNQVYSSPVLKPLLADFATLPADLGEVVSIAFSATKTHLIIATYDEHSPEEYKGSFVLLDLTTKKQTVHRNVMGKCVVAKGYDRNAFGW